MGSKLQPWWHSTAPQTAVVTLWVKLHIHCFSYMSDQWGSGSYCLDSAAEVAQPYLPWTLLTLYLFTSTRSTRIRGLGVAPSSATFLLPGCSWLSLELRFCSEHSCCFWLLLPDHFLPVNFKFESLGGQSLFHTQLFIAGFWVGPELHGFMTSIAWHYINQNCIVEALLLGDLYGCANDPGARSSCKLVTRAGLGCLVILRARHVPQYLRVS